MSSTLRIPNFLYNGSVLALYFTSPNILIAEFWIVLTLLIKFLGAHPNITPAYPRWLCIVAKYTESRAPEEDGTAVSEQVTAVAEDAEIVSTAEEKGHAEKGK